MDKGTVIRVKMPYTPSPSTLAASSISPGRLEKKVFTKITLKALMAPGMTMAQMVSRIPRDLAIIM
ncbi:hypothetical protein D3C81_2053490 [compost metagenome]